MWILVKTYAALVEAVGDGPFAIREKWFNTWQYSAYARISDATGGEQREWDYMLKTRENQVYPLPEDPELEWLVEEEDGETYRNRYHYTTEAGPQREQEARVAAKDLASRGGVKPELYCREVGPWFKPEGE